MGNSNSNPTTGQIKHVRFFDQPEVKEKVTPVQKKISRVMRVSVHSINNIERSTDIGSEVDPFVEVRANDVLLGATTPRSNTTSASIEQSFHAKVEKNPQRIKLRFHLKDKDHGEDDELGFGYFDLEEEDYTLDQTVYLKWKGKEIANIVISVDSQILVEL